MAKIKFVKSSAQASTFAKGTGLKGGLTSYSNNQIQPRVKIGSGTEATGSILKQKATKKFLVTDGASVQDESIVAGTTYVITTVGTTDWKALGGPYNATVGDIFVATKNGTGLTTSGVVAACGLCTLANTANGSMAANTMTITCTKADTSTFRAAKITNKHVWDFSGNRYLVGSAGSNATTPPTVAVARA